MIPPLPFVVTGAALTYMLARGLLTGRWSRASRAATAQDRASLEARPWSPALLVGLLPSGLGIGLAFSALGIFKSSRTTTVPFGTPSQLILRGPYRFTRNPMYLGLALAYGGVAVTNGQVWPLLLSPLVLAYVHWVVIPIEERRLHETFGDAYDH